MVGWRRWVHLGGTLAMIVVVYFVVPVSANLHRTTIARGAVTVVALGLLALGVVRQLKLHVDDTSRRLDGLIVIIVIVMIVFAFGFYSLQQKDPTQFAGMETRLDSLYFTMASAATVGFGDVHAAGQYARGLVLAQMVFNVVFVGTAVALLSTRVKAVASARAQARTTQRNPK